MIRWKSYVRNTRSHTLLTPLLPTFTTQRNSINNVERRLGTATLIVPLVWGSAVWAWYQFRLVSGTAAYMLSPMVAWLSVATCLVYSIWRINYKTSRQPSLFPSNEEGPRAGWQWPLFKSN